MRLDDDLEYDRLRHAFLSSLFALLLLAAAVVGVVWLWPGLGGDDGDAGTAEAPAPAGLERLAGGDRFSTSAAIAAELWPDGAETAVLATGFDYADALAGGPVAAAHDAPLLLSTTDELPPAVRQALVDLDPAEVILMGGEAALSQALEQEVLGLPGEPAVSRVAGGNRFETAGEAAERAGRGEAGDVVVATGLDFPDAVAAGALTAGEHPVPILLATDAELVLPLGDDERAFLVGGEGTLSAEVEAQAADQAAEVERLAGPERFATSQRVADVALRTRLSGSVPLVVATGEEFPDALSAGAVAARTGGALLLVPGGGPTDGQAAWISGHRERLSRVIVVGGSSAVSEDAAARLRDLVRGSAF